MPLASPSRRGGAAHDIELSGRQQTAQHAHDMGGRGHVVARLRPLRLQSLDKLLHHRVRRQLEAVGQAFGFEARDQLFLIEGLVPRILPIDPALEVNPDSIVRPGIDTFALTVRGNSMLEEGVLDGDILVLDRSLKPKNGSLVVAEINAKQTTLKRYYFSGGKIELRPANKYLESIYVEPEECRVCGVVRSIIRSFLNE